MLLAVALVGLSGCAKPPEAKARTWPKAPADPWRLVCTDPTQTTPAFLTNGWIGVRLNRLASGWEGETSLPAFAAHAYQTEGEEKIEALPNPLGVQWSLGDKPVSTGDLIAYEQVLDMKSGAMTTSFSVEGPSGEPIRFLGTTVLHPELPIAAERWEVVAATEEPIEASIAHLAEAKGAPGGGDRYELPQGEVRVSTRTSGRFAGSMPGRLRKYYFTVRDLTFERVAVCDFESAVRKIAQVRGSSEDVPAEDLPTPSFDEVLAASTEAWAKRWETDIGYWDYGVNAGAGREAATIGAWAAANGLAAVVWTNLPCKFDGKDTKPTGEQVVAFLRDLDDDKRPLAEAYVRQAPSAIDTPYRRMIAEQLGWHQRS